MRSKLVWTNAAWSDYLYWQVQDKKTLKRINLLIKDAMRDPEDGVGKPEALKESLSGLYSRRIDAVNRLVYAATKDELVIIACRYHY
ncbi:MAG: Txe/YoeB family addiction module toxin [Polynucleobacter sp.]